MSDLDSPASGSSSDPFTAALALLAAVGDPKAAAARLRELRGVLAEVERAQKDLAADKEAAEAALAAERTKFDAECAQRRAALEKAERNSREVASHLEGEKGRHADKLEYADRIIARWKWVRSAPPGT
jgi:hypothetical protein